MKFQHEAFWYIVIVATAQTSVTALASSSNLIAGACVGGASILANLILYVAVRVELARRELDRMVTGQDDRAPVRAPTASYLTIRQRALRSLAAKRRRATVA